MILLQPPVVSTCFCTAGQDPDNGGGQSTSHEVCQCRGILAGPHRDQLRLDDVGRGNRVIWVKQYTMSQTTHLGMVFNVYSTYLV
jgi:hypothetical protein